MFTCNLLIDCSKWYVRASDYGFSKSFDDDGNYKPDSETLPGYVYSEAFKALNPEPAQLITNTEGADTSDLMVWKTPAKIVVKNNWIHFNKFVRDFTNWGVAPYNIEEYVYKYMESPDDIDVEQGQRSNKNVSTYSSRRDTLDLKELITVTAAGVIEIDWDTFVKIGIVDSDWVIDTEIVSDMPQYR